MGVAHVRLKEANGITKVINSTTNLAALFVFLAMMSSFSPSVLWQGCSIWLAIISAPATLKKGARKM